MFYFWGKYRIWKETFCFIPPFSVSPAVCRSLFLHSTDAKKKKTIATMSALDQRHRRASPMRTCFCLCTLPSHLKKAMQRYSSEICSAKSLCRVHLISEQAKLNEGERACLLAANSNRPQSRVLSAWGSLMSRHAATVCPECLGLFPVTELRRFCSLITSDGLYMAACWLTTSFVFCMLMHHLAVSWMLQGRWTETLHVPCLCLFIYVQLSLIQIAPPPALPFLYIKREKVITQ